MMELKETYHLQSIFALSRAEDIWAAIETILYSSGRSYISKSAVIFRRFGQNNPHAGLSLILLSQADCEIRKSYNSL